MYLKQKREIEMYFLNERKRNWNVFKRNNERENVIKKGWGEIEEKKQGEYFKKERGK